MSFPMPKMLLKLCLFAILFVSSKSFYIDGTCPLADCTCSYEQIVCRSLKESLNLTLFNSTITKVIFENSSINGIFFTRDSFVENLTELTLEHCDFTDIDSDAFTNMTSLKSLKFNSYVDLQSLNFEYTILENLELSHCGLKNDDLHHLSNLFNQVPNLEKLDISENTFSSIDASMFSPLSNLKVLQARNCGIEKIEPFKLDAQLEEVDFSNNKLTILPEELLESSEDSLEKLSLSGNPFKEIDLNFTNFRSLTSLRLDGMELECSCSWMLGLLGKDIQPTDLKCHDLSKESDNSVLVLDFVEECVSKQNAAEEGGSNRSLVIVIIFLVFVTVAAIVGCLVHRVLSNRRRRAQEKKAVRYSAVYRETVETSAPSSRTTIDI